MAHRRSRAKSPEPNSVAFGMPAFEATFRKVSTIYALDYTAETAASFKAAYAKGGATQLSPA